MQTVKQIKSMYYSNMNIYSVSVYAPEIKGSITFSNYLIIPRGIARKDIKYILQKNVRNDNYDIILSKALKDNKEIDETIIFDLNRTKIKVKEIKLFKKVTRYTKIPHEEFEIINIFMSRPFNITTNRYYYNNEYYTFITDRGGKSKDTLMCLLKVDNLRTSVCGDFYIKGRYELHTFPIEVTQNKSLNIIKGYMLVKIKETYTYKKYTENVEL